MFFIFSIVIICLFLITFMVKRKLEKPFTTGALVALIFSILVNISLSQNYTVSLIEGSNDGIGISNKLAYWIITDNGWGRYWSTELFKSFYEVSAMVSILFLALFYISVIMERKLRK